MVGLSLRSNRVHISPIVCKQNKQSKTTSNVAIHVVLYIISCFNNSSSSTSKTH